MMPRPVEGHAGGRDLFRGHPLAPKGFGAARMMIAVAGPLFKERLAKCTLTWP